MMLTKIWIIGCISEILWSIEMKLGTHCQQGSYQIWEEHVLQVIRSEKWLFLLISFEQFCQKIMISRCLWIPCFMLNLWMLIFKKTSEPYLSFMYILFLLFVIFRLCIALTVPLVLAAILYYMYLMSWMMCWTSCSSVCAVVPGICYMGLVCYMSYSIWIYLVVLKILWKTSYFGLFRLIFWDKLDQSLFLTVLSFLDIHPRLIPRNQQSVLRDQTEGK